MEMAETGVSAESTAQHITTFVRNATSVTIMKMSAGTLNVNLSQIQMSIRMQLRMQFFSR